MKATGVILTVCAALMLVLVLPLATASGVNGNGTNGNGATNGNLIVEDPEQCPEGTTPVPLDKPLDQANPAVIDDEIIIPNGDYPQLYECVPDEEEEVPPTVTEEPPAVTEAPVAAQETTQAPAPVASLPATGMLLLIPAAGLAASGAGIWLLRKRT